MKKISLVVPCYNEQETISIFYEQVSQIREQMRDRAAFELIFVDDGSVDRTLSLMKTLHEQDPDVGYVSFSRNFGKEAALYAGLKRSSGDYVVVMDVDLQDPPELLVEMYDVLAEQEFDCVGTRRVTRHGEPLLRSFFARCFYRLINRISDTEIVDGARDFRMMTRQMVDAILSLEEYNRFSKGIFSWVGFRTKWIEYENVERSAGTTKWSFWKLVLYSLEGIIGFSTVPLGLITIVGLVFCLIALVMICVIVGKPLIFGDSVTGWSSLACITIFVGGIQMICAGILGQYLAKAYLETKQRPLYITKEEA